MRKIIGYRPRNRTRDFKNCFENVVYKKLEELTKSKIGDKIVKPKLLLDVNSRNIEELLTPPEKRKEI